jgi:hypothetical protein
MRLVAFIFVVNVMRAINSMMHNTDAEADASDRRECVVN